MEIANKIVFIGSGNMAQAIIGALLQAEMVKAANIVCNDIVEEKVEALSKRFGVSTAKEKGSALISADIIFLSVKPQDMKTALEDIKHFVKTDALVISIAAGVKTEFIEDVLAKKVAVVRAMPNTPALVLAGATVLCPGKYAVKKQLQKAKSLFSAIGMVEIEDESKFDAVTALSGSGPAYVFYLSDLMAQAGRDLGLDENMARIFVAQTIYGAGKMLIETGSAPSELIMRVKSPNGTTESALKYFESVNLKETVFKAMEAARNRSMELNKQ